MSEIRVLEIFREPIANGGQESFIMNMYRNVDRKKVQFDFLTPFTCDNRKLKEEVERLGGHIIIMIMYSEKKIIRFLKSVCLIF